MTEALLASLEHALPAHSPPTEELRVVLSRALEQDGRSARLVDIERASFAYGSSWWLEELTLELDDHSRVALIFKDLVREANGSAARRVKPAFATDPTREPWVYQNVLIDATPGPPKMWAALNDVAAGRHWLFLERVDGAPLAQIGERDAWWAAAEWLGRFHSTTPLRSGIRGPLLVHSRKYHRQWLARALHVAQRNAESSRETRDTAGDRLARLRALAPTHERAVEQVLATTTSLIHGEFYASNVLIEQRRATFIAHPVDWEMTALGPPLLDLAALMSGSWSHGDRIAMAMAYREAARSEGLRCPTLEDLLLGVAAGRLLLAVQWLGWAADWAAPEGHRNDWLEEAERCARELRG